MKVLVWKYLFKSQLEILQESHPWPRLVYHTLLCARQQTFINSRKAYNDSSHWVMMMRFKKCMCIKSLLLSYMCIARTIIGTIISFCEFNSQLFCVFSLPLCGYPCTCCDSLVRLSRLFLVAFFSLSRFQSLIAPAWDEAFVNALDVLILLIMM